MSHFNLIPKWLFHQKLNMKKTKVVQIHEYEMSFIVKWDLQWMRIKADANFLFTGVFFLLFDYGHSNLQNVR